MTDNFSYYLDQRLERDLPGEVAQLKMAPRSARKKSHAPQSAPSDSRTSSVLLAFFPVNGNYDIILTVRSDNIHHGGQICLPGGGIHPNETPTEAALREAREEVGIVPGQVNILGQLSPLYVNHSNNQVYPIIGNIGQKPSYDIDPAEVQEVFTVSLNSLTDRTNYRLEEWEVNNRSIKVPFWDLHGDVPLWGATAMILSEFLELYQEFRRNQNAK